MEKFICKYCGNKLSSYKSRWRHETKYCKHKPTIKKKINIKPKQTPTPRLSQQENNTSIEKAQRDININEELLNQINQLRHELHTIKQQPFQLQNITINNNYSIIEGNFYTALTEKIGKTQAIEFLARAAENNLPGEVFKKLYSDQSNYLTAAANGECIRYIDNDQLINDPDGNRFSNMISNRIQQAMIYATNELIKESISTNNTDQLYEFYDIGKIQHNIANLTTKKLHDDLKTILGNPSHISVFS